MDFTGKTIKTGQSVVGDFRLDYSISYEGENEFTKLDAQVKRVSVTPERYIGNIIYVASTQRYSCSLSEATTSEDRKALLADFENTIGELIK